jgi:hypothetical protein
MGLDTWRGILYKQMEDDWTPLFVGLDALARNPEKEEIMQNHGLERKKQIEDDSNSWASSLSKPVASSSSC